MISIDKNDNRVLYHPYSEQYSRYLKILFTAVQKRKGDP